MDTSADTSPKSQVQVVAEKMATAKPLKNAGNKKGRNTKVVFPSPLELTEEQEQKMVDHALQRITSLEKELGRNNTAQHSWYGGGENATIKEAAGSFMGKRQLYEMTYHNQLDWRSYLIGGIFAESNLTVPMSRRIAQQQIARSASYFLGTDPWFGAYSVGAQDDDKATILDKYLKYKAKKSELKNTVISSLEGAIIRGESVVKTVYRQDWTSFKSRLSVAVSEENGEPFVAADSEYITQMDTWVIMESEEGQVWILERDQETQLPEPYQSPEELIFEERVVQRQKVRYAGAEAKTVYYKDFLAPIDAESLDEADCVVHLYDKPAIEVASLYVSALEGEGGTTRETSAKIYESLQELVNGESAPNASANKPRPEAGESAGGDSGDSGGTDEDQITEPIIEIAEVFLHFDADEDGVQEDIVMMLDRKNKRPLFYDYVANRTPNGRRPFDVIRANRVDGRWHGIGTMEVFQPLQEVVDLLVNRWSLSQSRSGNVIFWRKDQVVEGENNPHLELNGGEVYTPKGNVDPSKILTVVPIYDIKGREIYKEVEFFMQVALNMSGVSNSNDAAMLGMDTGKLATGVRNIEKSGQEMFSIALTVMQDGLEEVLKSFVTYSMAYADKKEMFVYTENDKALSVEFDPNDIERSIEMDIRLEMTKYKSEQELEQASQATSKVIEFYSLPPTLQQRLAPLYRTMLRSFQITHVDEIISPTEFQLPPQASGGGFLPQEGAGQAINTSNNMAAEPEANL
jgi:hypothetical protein